MYFISNLLKVINDIIKITDPFQFDLLRTSQAIIEIYLGSPTWHGKTQTCFPHYENHALHHI